jgi:SRSO17 transposase
MALVKTSSKLFSFLEDYSDLFTRPSFCSFSHMTSAIAVCDKSKTISNLHETMADDNNKKKGRSSYNWFITDGDWDEDEVAQRSAYMFLEASDLKCGDMLLLIIDDTYNEKKGKKSEGVGKFYEHSKGYTWGHNFVTSVIQAKDLFIPHKAKMYIKKDEAGSDFKTKIEIAIKEIIKLLKIPEGLKLMVVFDC